MGIRPDGNRSTLIGQIAVLLAITSFLLAGLLSSTILASSEKERPRCPVCGMYADSDQRWPAEITLKGGQKVFFESPKHAFAYYLSVGEYAKGRKQTDVEAFTVRDWQTGKQVDARKYWYLVGSDIEGPMGADIVPLSEDGLKKLQATHKGERHQFNSVTREVLKKLDQAGSEACCEGHAR